MRLRNKNGEPRVFHISLVSDAALRIALEGTTALTVTVPADQTLTQRVYVSARKASTAADTSQTDFRFWVEDLSSTDRAYANTVFHGRVK